MLDLRSRRDFILTLGGGTAGLALLSACGGPNVFSGFQGNSAFADALVDTPELQRMLQLHKLVAVTQGTTTIVRDDFKLDRNLAQHLAGNHQGRTPMLTQVNGSGGGGNPQPSSSPDSLNQCMQNAQVGDVCGGLKVIAVVTAGGGLNGSTFDNYSGGFDSFSGGYGGGQTQWIRGPIYTAQRFLNCLQTQISDVKQDMVKIASEIVGGALTAYLQAGSITAVLNSARGLLAGTVSAWAFWDVLVAATTVVTLPELLTAAGIGLAIGTIFEVGYCAAFSG